MPRPDRRRIADDGASSFSLASPAIALLVSSQLATSARADDNQANLTPVNSPEAAHQDRLERSRATLQSAHDDGLLLPLDPEDANDSQFIRQLLLSHGIELDLEHHGPIGIDELEAIADQIGREDTPLSPSVRLLGEDALEATLLIDMRDTFGVLPARDRPARDGSTHYFRLLPLRSGPGTAEEPVLATAVPPDAACDFDADSLHQLTQAFEDAATVPEEIAALHDRIWRPAAERIEAETEDPGMRDGVSQGWRRVWLDCSALDIQELAATPEPVEPQQPDREADAGSVEGKPAAALPEPPQSAPAHPDTADPGADSSTARIEPAAPVPPPPASAADNGDTSTSGARSGAFFISDEAPAGFEGLLGPTVQFVDVRFNEAIVGTTTITVTAETFVFDDPEGILPMLKGVYDPESLLPFIAVELPTNAHRVCFTDNDPPGCGVVVADPFAAIFDENSLVLDIFIAPNLQAPIDNSIARYLESPERRGTSIVSLGVVGSQLQGGELSADGFARGLIGYGRGFVNTEVDFDSRSQQARLRELRLNHFFRDYELSVGSFPYSPAAGLGDVGLLGARYQTSFKTRVDIEQAFSSQLVVFLPRRAVVQLAVDGRVYSGDSYSAGNQTLDTRALPEGTYEVEIRIIESGGTTRTETRIFTKSTSIPPAGTWVLSMTAGLPLFFDEAGENDEQDDVAAASLPTGTNGFLPAIGDTAVIGLSASRRLTDQSAWRIGLVSFGSDAALQGSLFYLGQRVTAQVATSFGTSGLVSALSRLNVSLGRTVTSASILTSRHNEGSDAANSGIPLDDFDEASLSFGRSIGNTQLGLRGSLRRSFIDGQETERRQAVLTARRPLFNRPELRGFLSAELQHDGEQTRAGLGINLSFSRDPLSSSAFAGVEQTNGRTSSVLGANAAYQGTTARGLDWETGGYVTQRDEGGEFGVSAGLDHPWFSANLAADWTGTGSSRTRNTVASLLAHVGIDSGGVALGGQEFAESGLIIDIDGDPDGDTFDIVVNNRNVARGSIGTPQFLALSPFEAYRVKLVPTSLLSNGIGESVYEFTLFPGGIQRINLTARREILLVASLVDDTGQLITDALVEIEGNPALVDSSGVFQAEVAPGERLTVALGGDQRCEFTVPDASQDDELLIPDDPLRCSPL